MSSCRASSWRAWPLPPAVGALALAAVWARADSPWAAQVVSYTANTNGPPGPGRAVAGYTRPEAALGEPSRICDDDDKGPGYYYDVTMFVGAYRSNDVAQLVSIGAGGELVLAFDHAVTNDPRNAYGIDLLVFGNAFYEDVDPDPDVARTGDDPALLIDEPGRISVSQDGTNWIEAPGVRADSGFPTLGFSDSGNSHVNDGTAPADFTRPVDPAFDWRNRTYEQLRTAYDGAGGGAGVDLETVGLEWIRYVRIWQPATDEWSTEVDAIADVGPELAAWDLVVISAPPLCEPAVGTNQYLPGALVNCRVTAATVAAGVGTQQVCVGWSGTGSVPSTGTGTSTPVTVNADSSITWHWQTRVLLATGVSGFGSVTPSNAWIDLGGHVTVTAVPDAYAEFAAWSGDVQGDTNAATMAMHMTGKASLSARFRERTATNGVPWRWLAGHGLTNAAFDVEAERDHDHDLAPAWAEYHADTDPTDGDSVFRIISQQARPGSNTVTWTAGPAAAGRTFTVYVSTNGMVDWQPAATGLLWSADGTNIWADTNTPGRARSAYRVGIQ